MRSLYLSRTAKESSREVQASESVGSEDWSSNEGAVSIFLRKEMVDAPVWP